MKLKLLTLFLLMTLVSTAQTTHNLNWAIGSNGPEMDITIDVGDTVTWTWTDAVPHTVENVVGSAVETFNSGVLTGNGQTFSYTFTVEGVNDYFCGVHGAANMSGTITVENNLGIDEHTLQSFDLIPNPSGDVLHLEFSNTSLTGSVRVLDLLGKTILTTSFSNQNILDLDISKLKSGMYLVTVENGSKTVSKRLIKK